VAAGASQYSIGSPTDDEQFLVELINRARANPLAEAQRLRSTTDPTVIAAYSYFSVDLDLMSSQFAQLSPVPPLAISAALTESGRRHSRDMLEHAFQEHTGSDGSTLGGRVSAAGYDYANCAENIYAYAKGLWHAHASFQVDWGQGPGGMQDPPGHRLNIHDQYLKEAGVGVIAGSNGSVGPILVTEDFAAPAVNKAFITGVAYYDLNGNGFYDVGEGIGGVNVSVSGADFRAVTAASGGYAVPVTRNGTYTVTFTAPAMAQQQQIAVISGLKNVKVDLAPVYAPPTVLGPDQSFVGRTNFYQFSTVAAATSYRWRAAALAATNLVEGAENGLVNVSAVVSPGYSVVVTDVKASGTGAFHLAHPQASRQTLTLNRLFRGGAAGRLEFVSRLGWASAGQVAAAEVSVNQGRDWNEVWRQAGNSTRGETQFQQRGLSLSAFSGREFMVRFLYDYAGGSYFNQTDSGVGFYLDNITISGCEELLNPVVSDRLEGPSLGFVPPSIGDFALSVRARIGSRDLDWGPLKVVKTIMPVKPNAVVRLAPPAILASGQVQLEFVVLSGAANEYALWVSVSPLGPWQPDPAASLQLLAPSRYQVQSPVPSAVQAYYRIEAR
jgi:hypothetical protein